MMKKIVNICTQPIDYYGQSLAKRITYNIFAFGYTLAWMLGYFMSDLRYTLYTAILTVVVNLAVVIPPWPFYRRHPFRFKKLKKRD